MHKLKATGKTLLRPGQMAHTVGTDGKGSVSQLLHTMCHGTRTCTHVHVYVCMYVCNIQHAIVCVCVCVCNGTRRTLSLCPLLVTSPDGMFNT